MSLCYDCSYYIEEEYAGDNYYAPKCSEGSICFESVHESDSNNCGLYKGLMKPQTEGK